MNEILRSLSSRKSVREFEERAVEEEKTRAVLEAAFQAPTAGNQQLYTVLRVTDTAKKERLAVLCDDQPFVAKAPLVLLFLADVKRWYDAFGQAGAAPRAPGVGDLLLAVTDAVVAAQNAVVAAESLGLGSCYVGDVNENCEDVRALFSLPEYVFPAALLVIGYPTESQRRREKPARFDPSVLLCENEYRAPEKEEFFAAVMPRAKQLGAEEYLRRFCARKYNSAFSREMTRSVSEYLRQYEQTPPERSERTK